ncbi:hypothetical protein [Pantoea sp. A4]|uniref:hypothetical protein n=1 Tax=Pantoea sp. A4 TaxID=1225184 RepID=UPI00036C6FB4|nr:hypothetical protein [Pantoea sp. A4]
MKSVISMLWDQEKLPIKDGIYFSNGTSIAYSVESYPKKKLTKGSEFDFEMFYKDNKDEVTSFDEIVNIKLPNGFHCSAGEGSFGSEGFIAYISDENELQWVIYLEELNPFIKITNTSDEIIIAESSADIRLKIDVNNPLNMELV